MPAPRPPRATLTGVSATRLRAWAHLRQRPGRTKPRANPRRVIDPSVCNNFQESDWPNAFGVPPRLSLLTRLRPGPKVLANRRLAPPCRRQRHIFRRPEVCLLTSNAYLSRLPATDASRRRDCHARKQSEGRRVLSAPMDMRWRSKSNLRQFQTMRDGSRAAFIRAALPLCARD